MENSQLMKAESEVQPIASGIATQSIQWAKTNRRALVRAGAAVGITGLVGVGIYFWLSRRGAKNPVVDQATLEQLQAKLNRGARAA